MKTRKEFVQNCLYPSMPEKAFSLHHFFHVKSSPDGFFWLGASLSEKISKNCFILRSSSQEVKCFVSPKAKLFFDFSFRKGQTWDEVYSVLAAGDSLLIQVQKDQVKKGEIHQLEKLVLTSVSQSQVLFSPFSFERQKSWFVFLHCVQKALQDLSLVPVQTPSLVDCPGTEPDLFVFETELSLEKEQKRVFLPTSPEIHLKRLLCRGWTDIYEIKKCFRNREQGPFNHHEFYLLEWYRAHASLDRLIEDLGQLLEDVSQTFAFCSAPVLKKKSMRSLFKEYLGMELDPNNSKQDFIDQLKKMEIPFDQSYHLDDLFYLLFLNGIEPFLDKEEALIIYDYPAFQKVNARVNSEAWASRFELFWKGMELANAYDEVIEAKEQESRFRSDLQKRKQKNKLAVPFSSSLLADMKAGMPPASGISLGLDRLFLIFTKLSDIKQMRHFP